MPSHSRLAPSTIWQRTRATTIALGIAIAATLATPATSASNTPEPSADAPIILSADGDAVRVVDGDTIKINGERVRVFGIDAPESAQRCAKEYFGTWACGEAATGRMRELIAGALVQCVGIARDKYGRLLAKCFATPKSWVPFADSTGVDVGGVLVREGLAWAYSKYSKAYTIDESAARAAGRGVWRAPTAPAWEWRKRKN
jgi:endonuclease YncB( thermonuclease family)